MERIHRPQRDGQERLEDGGIAQEDARPGIAAGLHRGLELRADESDLRFGDARHRGSHGARDVQRDLGADQARHVGEEAQRPDVGRR